MSSAERISSEWDTGTMCENFVLSLFMASLCRVRNKAMYILSWRTVHALTRMECYFSACFVRCHATQQINTKIIPSWGHEQFATQVHTLFYMYSICHTPEMYVHTYSMWRNKRYREQMWCTHPLKYFLWDKIINVHQGLLLLTQINLATNMEE